MDLIKRNFCRFTFPVEQVQTVYRLLARAEPSSLEWLLLTNAKEAFSLMCLLITSNRFKTLVMGNNLGSSPLASTARC